MGEVLARRAARNPDKEAVVDATSGERLTYRQLDRRANQVANALVDVGVSAGDRVAVVLPNGIRFLECFFGSAKVGAIVVLLNWRLVADELEYLLVDSGATLLIFGEEFSAVVADLE